VVRRVEENSNFKASLNGKVDGREDTRTQQRLNEE
jgi:hypothetical protein